MTTARMLKLISTFLERIVHLRSNWKWPTENGIWYKKAGLRP